MQLLILRLHKRAVWQKYTASLMTVKSALWMPEIFAQLTLVLFLVRAWVCSSYMYNGELVLRAGDPSFLAIKLYLLYCYLHYA